MRFEPQAFLRCAPGGQNGLGGCPLLWGTDVSSQRVLVHVPSGGEHSGTCVGYMSANATCSLSTGAAGLGSCLVGSGPGGRGPWAAAWWAQGLCRRSRALTSAPTAPLVQVNIGILVAVTRVISRISADSYKIHGDPSAFK